MCRMKLFQVLLTTTHSRNYRRIGGEWGIESSGGTKLCENQKKKKKKRNFVWMDSSATTRRLVRMGCC